MNENNKRWRNGDLVRAVPISRGDLNQAISRVGYRPEHTPEPGKDRWYGWRDVVAIAVAQDLRIIGYGPKIAFGLVQDHLLPFMRTSIEPDDCDGVLWMIHAVENRIRANFDCEFVQHDDANALLIASRTRACIVVNVGMIARRVLDNLHAQQVAAKAWADVRTKAIADARTEYHAHVSGRVHHQRRG